MKFLRFVKKIGESVRDYVFRFFILYDFLKFKKSIKEKRFITLIILRGRRENLVRRLATLFIILLFLKKWASLLGHARKNYSLGI
ncbi:MAG: hypothetical protein COV90_01745 [Candidatus Tagabacteria bacterium CG11_big_fil_rev_8_21_14_0_20_41_11]|nr:MAG: hypothetical protein COV90_01745 [Candidatus Tagabacteria bacterium CG11_big_fil_rev_8_21_14_0_20_41_11]